MIYLEYFHVKKSLSTVINQFLSDLDKILNTHKKKDTTLRLS